MTEATIVYEDALEKRLAPIESKVDAVVDLVKRIPQKQELSELYAALAKAQAEIKTAEASRANEFFGSNYADLADCWDACREPLSKNGLCVIQLPMPTTDGKVRLKTILAHESGQSIETECSMIPKDQTPQAIGSALTYLRRYMLCAIVGIAQGGADDDGQAATGDQSEYERITKEEVEQIVIKADKLFGERSDAALKKMCDRIFGVAHTSDIPAGEAEVAITNLENAAKTMAKAKAKKEKEGTKKERIESDDPMK